MNGSCCIRYGRHTSDGTLPFTSPERHLEAGKRHNGGKGGGARRENMWKLMTWRQGSTHFNLRMMSFSDEL